MELNLQMKHELRRLSELSVQLKEVENLWAESYTNRQNAEERGEGMYVLFCDYSVPIMNAEERITSLKNMILEHVRILVSLTDAQLRTDGAKD